MMEHEKVIKLLASNLINKVELSDKLGITRVTLDKRLKYKNWKKGELAIIRTL